MNYKHQYTSEVEREELLLGNADKRLIEEQNISDGNFLIFTDEPYAPDVNQRVSTLEQDKSILELALAESIEKQETDRVTNQLVVAELIEALTIKGSL